jgi:orotate phosphoribosyltransferase
LSEELSREFIRFALDAGVLRFGSFITKAGRDSPYFFNAGLFDDGERLGRLAGFYASALVEAQARGQVSFDMFFGPAYKGIPLAAATAVALAGRGRNLGFAYNRKEAKDHGEGGVLVGAPMRGRVLIIDDVISAGTSVRESVDIIRAAGAEPAGVLIALDRQERGGTAAAPTAQAAVEEVRAMFGMPVIAIATLADLIAFLSASDDAGELASHRDRVAAYRARYGSAG